MSLNYLPASIFLQMIQIFILNQMTSCTHLQKIMNRELKKVKKWLDANHLSLSIDKTKFVIFHPPRIKIPKPVIVKFGRKKIQRENCVKFLGVLLDANLSWKYHINELLKKLSRTLGLFYKIRYYVPLEILKQLHYSLFYSFFSYGITVWGLTCKSLGVPLHKGG